MSGRKEAGRILEELRGCFQERRAAIYEAGIQKEREKDLSRWQAWRGSTELLEFYDDEESL